MTTISPKDSIITSELTADLFVEIMRTISHPCIFPVKLVDYIYDRKTAVVIRKFMPEGSIRDRIHQVAPKKDFFAKYGKRSEGPLPPKEVLYYSRHILEALWYLKALRIPYGHLNASNLLVKDGLCCLVDIENSLLGLSPLYLQYMDDLIQPEVICFGHVLFQMSLGHAKGTDHISRYQPKLSPPVYKVLESIFSPTTGEQVTINSLLKEPVFANLTVDFNTKDAIDLTRKQLDRKMKAFIKRSRDKFDEMIQHSLLSKSTGDVAPKLEDGDELEDQQPLETLKGKKVMSKKEEKAFERAQSGYKSLNKNDPLNPENRQKAAMRAKRRQQQAKRKVDRRQSRHDITRQDIKSNGPERTHSNGERRRRKRPSADTKKETNTTTSSTKTPTTTTAPSAPKPPAPPAAPAPPKAPLPPPSAGGGASDLPPPQAGRANLLDSIRKANKSKLKH
eukprot:CAMPEP_0174277940 /NCGR_PEP_ID=MMETSP0439-20130205/61204_1 /TAXON_ID=0 /ORGANISM="Stereomyxa ramosa, Strain Chinc5" /LENGTH=448 /DNA_ID=CAMNT_0015370305 /DNA_START=414 /DNA_END=1757 /DNA_ORIENTATION=+